MIVRKVFLKMRRSLKTGKKKNDLGTPRGNRTAIMVLTITSGKGGQGVGGFSVGVENSRKHLLKPNQAFTCTESFAGQTICVRG